MKLHYTKEILVLKKDVDQELYNINLKLELLTERRDKLIEELKLFEDAKP